MIINRTTEGNKRMMKYAVKGKAELENKKVLEM